MLEVIEVGGRRAAIRVEHLLPFYHDGILLPSGNADTFHLRLAPWANLSWIVEQLRSVVDLEANRFACAYYPMPWIESRPDHWLARGLILDDYWCRLFTVMNSREDAVAGIFGHESFVVGLSSVPGDLSSVLGRAERLRRLPLNQIWGLLPNGGVDPTASSNAKNAEDSVQRLEHAGHLSADATVELAQARRSLAHWRRLELGPMETLAIGQEVRSGV